MASSLWGRLLDWLRSLLFAKEMELSLVGLQAAGKSSLVGQLCTGTFAEDLIPTVGFNMRKATRGGVIIKLWDLGGQPRFRSMWERYTRGCQAVVFVADAADAGALDAARAELHDLMLRPSLAGTPLLVVANKADLPEALGAAELSARLDVPRVAAGRDARCVSVSCRTGAGVDEALRWLLRHARAA